MKDETSSPIKALRASAHMFGESLNKITNGVLIAGPHYSVYGGAIITDHLIASDLINVLTDVQTDAKLRWTMYVSHCSVRSARAIRSC